MIFQYKWWEHQKEDSTVKWETLSHNGVLFPPPYEPLPSHVKMKYDGTLLPHACLTGRVQLLRTHPFWMVSRTGQEVILPPESEEVAGFFGKMIETDHAQDKIFRKNFFNDFLTTLKKFPPVRTVCRLLLTCSVTDQKRLSMTPAEKQRQDHEPGQVRLWTDVRLF